MRQFWAVLVALATIGGNLESADWPQWRGPDRTGLSSETGLLKSWPAGGPKRLWLYDNAGLGYSSPAIVSGKYVSLGTRVDQEVLLSLDAVTGKELWATPIATEVFQNQWGGGPRGTPTVEAGRIYVLGARGDLVCAELETGKIVWQQNLTKLGGKIPFWGYSESVLVTADHVLCTPAGASKGLTAFDKKTGKVVWQTDAGVDSHHYSSVMPATIHGRAQYVQLSMKFVAGFDAANGRQLWSTPWPGRIAMIPTPVIRDNRVYVTAGYTVGCRGIALGKNFEVETVFENKVMKNHHGGVVLVGDHLYGHADPGWTCQNFKTGQEVWNHRGFGKGAIGYADGMLYCVDEGSGEVALVEASPEKWNEKGRFKLDPQTTLRTRDARIWTHPIVVDGRLYLRDQDLIYCYLVK